MNIDTETFLDDEFLRKLEKLKVITRKSTRSPQRGEHRSWQSGEGLEFLDYRKYHLGDDLRYVDWSVYGRLDKLFIKLFHAEKGQTAQSDTDEGHYRARQWQYPPLRQCTGVQILDYLGENQTRQKDLHRGSRKTGDLRLGDDAAPNQESGHQNDEEDPRDCVDGPAERCDEGLNQFRLLGWNDNLLIRGSKANELFHFEDFVAIL